MGTIADKLARLAGTKEDIRQALLDKGRQVEEDTPFSAYGDQVRAIEARKGPLKEKEVNLYDYDGALVETYTPEEFALLEALPDPPEHEGLTFQGYNYTLDKAKAYVAKYGYLNIGAIYITDDGATRIKLDLVSDKPEALTVPLKFSQTVEGGVSVDWGDGSPVETDPVNTGYQYCTLTHSYAQPGKYTISLSVAEGCTLKLGGESSTAVFAEKEYLKSTVTEVNIGARAEIGGYAFELCYSMEYLTLPKGITTLGKDGFAFYSPQRLTAIILPEGITSVPRWTFGYCSRAWVISLPEGVETINENAFMTCSGVTSIVIPEGCKEIWDDAFIYCTAATWIVVPDGVTHIYEGTFFSCTAAEKIILSPGLKELGVYGNGQGYGAFAVATSWREIRIPETVESMGKGVFDIVLKAEKMYLCPQIPPTTSGMPISVDERAICFTIYVPAESVEAYKTAEGWSAYADRIEAMP